jgi:hypothetical protein
MKIWSRQGVALYPPEFCMVGQNKVFNALHQFRRQFWDGKSNDIAGFFVVIGDWGLGKTRLGYELVAETMNHIDRWILNPDEHILAPFHQPNVKARVLEPQFSDRVLPLYVRYWAVCQDGELEGENWVAKVSVDALQDLFRRPPATGVPARLYEDLANALHAKGVDLEALEKAVSGSEGYDDRLRSAMAVLRSAGIEHIWVVVDEVETPGDLKRGLPEDDRQRVDEEYLWMVAEVIKHEGWRNVHPYINFLLLCSKGMQQNIAIGPNMRRASIVPLEPNQVTDVHRYVAYLKAATSDPAALSYPKGTTEGAFLAANRNFGWFNVIMASIHESHQRHRARGESPEAWELLREFAQTEARAKHIFNDSVLAVIGKVPGVPNEIIHRLVFGQLPMPVGGGTGSVTEEMGKTLLAHQIPGRGAAFADLQQVHIDERTLATELTRPEFGFKHREGDTYYYTNCELSVGGLLQALRAFSVGIEGGGGAQDFIIYRDLEQWGEQLGALYPRDGIEFAAEALHRIFTQPDYIIKESRFLGMSFRLWKEFDRLLTDDKDRGVSFFKDSRHEQKLDDYLKDLRKSERKWRKAVCDGLAKLLDDRLEKTSETASLSDLSHSAFNSGFVSPQMDGLRVTPTGQVTVVYCHENDPTATKLLAFLGTEAVHPILVIFPPSGDLSGFEHAIAKSEMLKRCVITKRMNTFEEEFLAKYSARNTLFDPDRERLSQRTDGLLGNMRSDWRGLSREWSKRLEANGYLLAPIWSKDQKGGLSDFYRAYRYMLANDCSIDALPPEEFDDVARDNVKTACKRNFDAPKGWQWGDLLQILEPEEPYRPYVPLCFITLLRELQTQASTSNVVKRFFFGVPDDGLKSTKQVEQILELLMGIGLVVQPGDNWRAVNRDFVSARRQSASTWLAGAFKERLKDLQTLFPSQVGILLKGEYPLAKVTLDEAEKGIEKIQFDALLSGEPASVSPNSFQSVVKTISDIESQILTVCPLDDGQSINQFDCSPARIASYQQRYNGLSLWERVGFLIWFKESFAKARDEILAEIEALLAEASDFEQANGFAFPVAPLTLPLKAIQGELQAAAAGGTAPTQTRRAAVQVASYMLEIEQYLVTSKYDEAWKRLDALHGLVSKSLSSSFYSRFKQLYDQWKRSTDQFKTARDAWERLQNFIVDAPSDVMESLRSTKSLYAQMKGLVEGGLKAAILAKYAEGEETQLLEDLKTEIEAATPKFGGLPTAIEADAQDIHSALRQILRADQIQSLNRVRRACGVAVVEEPKALDTYKKTKERYEAFNTEIAAEGTRYFEGNGKATTWSLWIEICSQLQAGTYDEDKHPDHYDALREFKDMKLVRSRLELR